ncbi:MAG: xanthine dehydrogenase family protein molybdopterin-binding subunit [Myxococcales bacterium]|nr:xanthine dehydrogenase family protein molybdopterin-binding subunit [Myxococcales bacterium]MCB9731666.1 xanthine dehydrogenase family protein molybdopterin-binding subunit [Deltaproteobacteria bacterium]
MAPVSRRLFLKSSAAVGAGLVLGVHLPMPDKGFAAAPEAPPQPDLYNPNAFIRIAPDNTVTLLSKHIEFGQGPYTGLATLVAEELGADWGQMRAEGAPGDLVYQNIGRGMQLTGGSSSIRNSYLQMRRIGATARAMLVAAAAKQWEVPAVEVLVDKGVLTHSSGKKATMGELAEAAMALPAPAADDVKLKDPESFTLIGRELPRLDTPAKLDGSARYTIDVDRENQVVAMIERPPRFGAKLTGFDEGAAKRIPGFVAAKEVPGGVAVYADGFWPAKMARHALNAQWDESGAEHADSDQMIERFKAKLGEAGKPAADRGGADAVLDKPAEGDKVLTADYVFPYLAHAPMEPLDCVIERTADGGVEAWYGAQAPTIDQMAIAKVLGVPLDKVKINVLFAGGSFGRRAQGDASLAVEAAQLLASAPEGRPVKLVWTREDDIRGGYYRPLYVHRLEAVVRKNEIAAWRHRIVGQSIFAWTPFPEPKDGIDPTSVEGARNLPYGINDFKVELTTEKIGIPVLWWRSVGSTHTAFSTETFMDEVLAAAGLDPVEGRLAMLAEHPRHAGVLRAVAELADWGKGAPAGRAYGVALHESFQTYVAEIAEVSLDRSGMPKVHKVYCAVDCGVAVNPNIIAAQMEGGIGYGLGAALFNAVDVVDGRVVQRNFDDYKPLRMGDMPEVSVTVVKSGEAPTGVGEPGVPPVAPAVANAFARLTGKRVRHLPFARALGGA